MQDLLERFESKTMPVPESGCWLWLDALNRKDYGWVGAPGGPLAHRAAWTLFRGPIPKGAHVLHKCDVRCCVNPDHLYLGNNDQNLRDRMRRGRSAKGEDFPHSRLTEEAVREIRADTKHSLKELARMYGAGKETVRAAKIGLHWKHVD